VCQRGNYIREMPGWRIRLIDCRFQPGPHKIIITTPTGHYYPSRAPEPPKEPKRPAFLCIDADILRS
jgi:hypothetical protein